MWGGSFPEFPDVIRHGMADLQDVPHPPEREDPTGPAEAYTLDTCALFTRVEDLCYLCWMPIDVGLSTYGAILAWILSLDGFSVCAGSCILSPSLMSFIVSLSLRKSRKGSRLAALANHLDKRGWSYLGCEKT